jgi:hypothetical protein
MLSAGALNRHELIASGTDATRAGYKIQVQHTLYFESLRGTFTYLTSGWWCTWYMYLSIHGFWSMYRVRVRVYSHTSTLLWTLQWQGGRGHHHT